MVAVGQLVFLLTLPCCHIDLCGYSLYSIDNELLHPYKQSILQ